MPKKQPENHPSSLISHLANHAKSTSSSPFPLEGLPGEAWKCLCLVAWKRLERINPRWADLIEVELGNFRTTWKSSSYWCRKEYLGSKAILSRHGGNVGDAWLVEAFQSMLDTSLKKGQKPLDNPRWIEAKYNELLFALRALKNEYQKSKNKPLRERENFWRQHLQGILNQQPFHDDTRRHATVTEAMIQLALYESSSEVAFEVLRHLYNYSPSTLKKKIFPRLKKTHLSPVEFWREKLLKSPR